MHCHILPGIDDGALDLADSIAMGQADGDGWRSCARRRTSATITTYGSPSWAGVLPAARSPRRLSSASTMPSFGL
jgi:hypothetical protein